MWGAVTGYALAATRHMHEYGTTNAQMADMKVAASLHAQHNPHAFLQHVFTVDEVLESPMIRSPLHRDDCCVVTDGGGRAWSWSAPRWPGTSTGPAAKILGHGEAVKHADERPARPHLHRRRWSRGPGPSRRRGSPRPTSTTSSIYDSFTITVIETLEDLGFCEKGEGGRVRARRHPRRPGRQAAVQHRRRRPVQQPPLEPGRR